jgi:Ca2+/H+ antiporter, TMEM165/GDT1 family
MELRIIATTFAVVFVAELADKTQLVTFGMAAAQGSRWSVFLGSALALVLSSALAVLLGGALARYISPVIMMRVAGLMLLVIGGVTLFSSFRGVQGPQTEGPGSASAPEASRDD